jgi:predicted alpha/beta hydrolase family esterase
MQTIIIPGYSHKNREWALEVQKNIPDSQVHEWKHWSDSSIRFDAKDETHDIQNLIGDTEVNIIAKSIGTLVVMMALKNLKVKKLILCGIPINDLNEDDKWNYKILSDLPSDNVMVFQNSDDEHGSFVEVRKFLSQINPNVKIIEKPGKTHDYPYYEEFKKFLE